jgi:pimeloyl-ACP methyl ester carboxylesterase
VFLTPRGSRNVAHGCNRAGEDAVSAATLAATTLAGASMATKALGVSDKLRNWWTGCSNEGLRLAEQAWFASAVKTPTTVTDVDIGDGQFLHTLSVAASPAAPRSSRPLVVLHGYGQGIGVWAKAVDPLHKGLGPDHGGIHLVDWLGCGLSSRPKFTASSLPETEAFFVDSLEAWCESMGQHLTWP